MIKILLFIALAFNLTTRAQTPDENLAALHINLPAVPPAAGNYIDVVRVGNTLYLSGKGPRTSSGTYITGCLGRDLEVTEGYNAARTTALIQLAVLQKELGSLNKVKRIVRVTGYVNSAPGFYEHPKVINGFSDLMVQVFGDKGRHARTALGVAALPFNMAVEVELIVEIEAEN